MVSTGPEIIYYSSMSPLLQFDPYAIPEEVLLPCHSLVFVVGLEPQSNPSDAAIWDALSQLPKSAEQPNLLYQLVSLDQLLLPPVKAKRQSYEWYTPKGVLRSNWLLKYQQRVPALVTVFHALDWTDAHWQDSKTELVNNVAIVKSACEGRDCRVAVVLLQNSATTDPATAPTPQPDAALNSERAAALCSECDLPAQHLFVLPSTDRDTLPGYAARLEAALSEIASGFYQAAMKTVRSHRDYLNKTNHALLFVRHAFKLGVLAEMRADLQGAIKSYQQSYQHLSELRYTDTNLHELRLSSAIINYKVCRVNFLLNQPRDAITHFRRHIELFRPRMGPKALLFEHYAWLATQYEVFGQLFESAVLQGLPAVQTQHPGFYYQQAAQFAAQRRTTAQHLCAGATADHANLLNGWNSLEIYGQRPWRPGKHSLEPPEPEREAEGMEAVQHRELTVCHSDVIIDLYTRAITQFQRYKCPRIRQQLMVNMAVEHHRAGDHVKALTVLQHVLWQYRLERWWKLVSRCSALALQCAYAAVDVGAYLTAAMEGLGPQVTMCEGGRNDLYQHGLLRVIEGEPPAPPPPLEEAQDDGLMQAWRAALTGLQDPVTVDMSIIAPCIEVRASFSSQTCPAYSSTPLTVHLRNNFTETFIIRDLRVSLSHQQTPPKSPSAQRKQGQESSGDSAVAVMLEACTSITLQLPPSAVQRVEIPFVPEPLPGEVSCLKITSVSCLLVGGATETHYRAAPRLQWTGPGNGVVTAPTRETSYCREMSPLCADAFATLPVTSELQVTSRESVLDIEVVYASAALVWEWLPVVVRVTVGEHTVEELTLSLGLQQPITQTLEQTTQVCSSVSACSSESCSPAVRDVSLSPSTTAAAAIEHTLYVRALTAATRQFRLTVRYNTRLSVKGRTVVCPCECTRNLAIAATTPFKVDVHCESSTTSGPVSAVSAGQMFLVVPRIVCAAPVSVTLTRSQLMLSPGVEAVCSGGGCVAGCEMLRGEIALDCFSVRVAVTAATAALPLGHYLLHWQRSGSSGPPVSLSVALPSLTVQVWGVSVTASVPPHTALYTPTPVTYSMHNTSAHSLECLVTMEQSQHFMFTGNQQTRLRVLSGQCESLSFVLYPAVCGLAPLPRLSVTLLDARPGQMPAAALCAALPSQLLVKPQPKPLTFSEAVTAIATV